MKHTYFFRFFFAASVMVLLTIFFFSTQDASTSKTTSTYVTEVVQEVIETFSPSSSSTHHVSQGNIRDLAHIGLFFIFGACCMLTFACSPLSLPKASYLTFCIGLVAAFFDECIQLTSDGRAFEVVDLTKDMLGVSMSIIGVCLLWGCYTLYRQNKKGTVPPTL